MNSTAVTTQAEIFDPVIHAQLRREAKSVATNASIPINMLWTTMVGECSPDEIDYVRGIHRYCEGGCSGYVYTGTLDFEVTRRFQLVAGTLLRNFVNAKVMTLQDVLNAVRNQVMPNPTVLLIPNFFDGVATSVLEWQGNLLLDTIMARQLRGKQTILYISDIKALGVKYGNSFERFIRDNYKIRPAQ